MMRSWRFFRKSDHCIKDQPSLSLLEERVPAATDHVWANTQITYILRIVRIVCRLRPEDFCSVVRQLQLFCDTFSKLDPSFPTRTFSGVDTRKQKEVAYSGSTTSRPALCSWYMRRSISESSTDPEPAWAAFSESISSLSTTFWAPVASFVSGSDMLNHK